MRRAILLCLILGTVAQAGPVPPFVTLFMRTVLDDADAPAARTTLAALGWSSVPATASSAGTAGDVAYDADYLYVCVALNTWKRVAIATWGVASENIIYAGENVIYAGEQVEYP